MTKEKPTKKAAAKKKTAAKKEPVKKAVAKKTVAPHKRPASKSVIVTKSANESEIKIEVTAKIPDEIKQVIDKSATVVKANDIINPSLRARALKWFTRK
jgi:hypothetical protein